MKYGHKLGLISAEEWQAQTEKQARIHKVLQYLQTEKIVLEKKEPITLKNYLKKPHVKYQDVIKYKQAEVSLSEEEIRHIESEVKYEGYLKKQEKEIARIAKIDNEKIPRDMDYCEISGLTAEVREKLKLNRPHTLGEAKKIPGITPAALINIHIHLKIKHKEKTEKKPKKHGMNKS
jgi:tRNA uridine 5-carboxymethylaminomethyl modification enzyme